jgi:HK97 family phage major capsid protein
VATYNSMISRTGTYGGGSGPDPLVPEPVATQIIQALPTQCALLQVAKHVPMSSKTNRLPVLDVLPVAYWVGGDTGMEQTSNEAWKNVTLVAEELATIVPIPVSYLDDADVPVWEQVLPRMTEAAGKLIDSAGVFGTNRPSTWSSSLYEGAVAAGNVVTEGTGQDLGVDVTSLGEVLADDGYSLDGFISRPGLDWKLRSLRSTGSGVPIYEQNLQDTPASGMLYGRPLGMVDNGSWIRGQAQMIAGDFDMALLGLRQDISFRMFDQGVVSDDTGKVILNLMQQNAVAMRMVMRVAFVTANPVTAMNANSTTRYPFAVLASAGSGS